MRSLALLALLAGCVAEEPGERVVSREELKYFPVGINRDLDILFVIDDSTSMADEQAAIAASLPVFVQVLETMPGGTPNLHIGVVTSGGEGKLRVGDETCRPVGTPYIADNAVREGGRIRNYPGTLADAVACNALVGAAAPDAERHLEAMRRALDGSRPANAGFLRDNAFLAVVFITDEDDRSPGDVVEYAAFLKNVKGDDGLVAVSVVAADPQREPCPTAQLAARLAELADLFPNRATFTSICEDDLSDAFALFTYLHTVTLGAVCIEGVLAEPLECVVSELVDWNEILLAHCDDTAALPCWRLVEDRAACPYTPTGRVLEIERSGASVPPGTYVQLRCLLE